MKSKNIIKNLPFLVLLAILLVGCTRDDICPSGTATTPNLIIRFKNKLDTTLVKKVIGLSVKTDYENPDLLIAISDTDSISLPLNINSDTTRYKLIKTTVVGSLTMIKEEKIEVIYQREDLYVNRACGFKMRFNSLTGSKIQDPNMQPWIQNIKVVRDTVNDETKAHINIFH